MRKIIRLRLHKLAHLRDICPELLKPYWKRLSIEPNMDKFRREIKQTILQDIQDNVIRPFDEKRLKYYQCCNVLLDAYNDKPKDVWLIILPDEEMEVTNELVNEEMYHAKIEIPRSLLLQRFAKSIIESGDFSLLPMLGDALEEEGCTNQELLHHCRKRGEHLYGCWAINSILRIW